MTEEERGKLHELEREIRYRMDRLYHVEAEDETAGAAARLAARELFERRRSDAVLDDERLLAAGAAEACCQYLLMTQAQEGGVTRFQAGDVAYSVTGGSPEQAMLGRDRLMAQAACLLRDPASFVFRGV